MAIRVPETVRQTPPEAAAGCLTRQQKDMR
jgi:hypothetical protein